MRLVIFVGVAIGVVSGIIFTSSHAIVSKAPTAGIDTLSVTQAAKSMPSEQYPAH
jgi:hypothetical protein